MRKLASAGPLLLHPCRAKGQTPASPQPTVRYHFGDNSLWANPAFDDNSWPVAQNGFVPSRSRDTNRSLWVRIRVPVPDNLNSPLALHLADLGVQPMTWEAFVNGQTVGGQGAFPPHADPADPPVSPVLDLPPSARPAGLRGSGRAARVACPRLL